MELLIKRHDKELPMPARHGDWIDLYAAETVQLATFQYYRISLGISIKLPEGYEAWIIARSSTFEKFGVIIPNCVGMIDNTYCGNDDIWRCPVLATRETTIHKGDRICQFRIAPNQSNMIHFTEVETMTEPSRGGFGSTGVK